MSFQSKVNDMFNKVHGDWIHKEDEKYKYEESTDKPVPGYVSNYNYLTIDYLKKNKPNNKVIIIVGTLTPEEGREKEFFYSSSGNNLFRFLDNYFKWTSKDSLVWLKNTTSKHEEYRKKIMEKLYSENIYFLDVVGKAKDGIKSAADDDIENFHLDKKSFENINKYITQDSVFIFNSRNSQKAYMKMFNIEEEKVKDIKINEDISGYKYFYIPQITRHMQLDELKELWKDSLCKIMSNI